MIIIPMAGLSRRFAEAGYALPKYMLPLHGRSVFAHAIGSFASCFADRPFLFIARDIAGTADFIAGECAALGIADARVALLTAPTAGQAETVALGLAGAAVPEAMPLTIFNIDTFRPGFRFPETIWFAASDGYLEVFRGGGANWSYVRPAPGAEPLALETAEKRPISDLCCTGLYHFARTGDFHAALAAERAAPSAPELYVAPLYNHLIRRGGRIHYQTVAAEEVVFCGIPAEYEALLQT
ncbi:MAG: hypothetical protein JWP04_3040 [Belnapia sp.]|nr:hypothetical protein [Belnapia sp.]